MNDRAVRESDRLLSVAIGKLDGLHAGAVAPVLKKHQKTLERLEKLEKDGAYGRARVLVRTSGIIKDLAKALASVGKESASIIREEMRGVREVARRDDAEEVAPTGGAG